MFKLAILGSTGRMGMAVKEALTKRESQISLVLEVSDRNTNNYIECDVIIDFSRPEAIINYLKNYPKQYKKPVIISGTTGFSAEEMLTFKEFSTAFTIFWSSNMSFGVNILKSAAEMLANNLPLEVYDVEILEKHHKMKIDSPSGTAISLGSVIADARGQNFENVKKVDRSGKRTSGDIGFAVQRAGGIVGYHQIDFINEHERIFIGHEAFDRSIFAHGAILFAKTALEKKYSLGFYSISDLLKV